MEVEIRDTKGARQEDVFLLFSSCLTGFICILSFTLNMEIENCCNAKDTKDFLLSSLLLTLLLSR